MSAAETLDHHGSHQDLLWADETSVPRQGIDAIIVPTARQPAYLDKAAALARELDCTLLTLHSKRTSAAGAAHRLAHSDLIAVDVPDPAHLRLPDWETSRLLAGPVFARRTDVSAKRNLGLLLSHLLGWSRVLFLDDDIHGLNPDDVRRASGLLDTHNAVGLHIGGFPDNSVVCHAYRQAGGRQQSFIGGGALAVQVERSNSFFPDIYNEDWFFLLDGDKGIQPVARTGEVRQYPYDPFRTPDRARAEELGDVLAEGLYWLLDQDRSIMDADPAHWGWFLQKRKRFIQHVLGLVDEDDLERSEKARRVAALKGALGRLALITPELCADYLLAWAADRQRWQDHLGILSRKMRRHPSRGEPAAALAMLSRPGSPPLTWRFGGCGSRPASRTPQVPPSQPAPLQPARPASVPDAVQDSDPYASDSGMPEGVVAAGVPARI